MWGMLKQHEVEVLLKASHRKTKVAQDDNTNGRFGRFCARGDYYGIEISSVTVDGSFEVR
jgi:hypothetical protein